MERRTWKGGTWRKGRRQRAAEGPEGLCQPGLASSYPHGPHASLVGLCQPGPASSYPRALTRMAPHASVAGSS